MTALLLVGALAIAACSDDTTQKGTAQRDDVIGAANAVCAQASLDAKADIAAYKSRFGGADPSDADAKDYLVNTVGPHADAAAAGMHNLPSPLKDNDKWVKALDAIDTRLRDFKYRIDVDAVSLARQVGTANPDAPTAVGALFVDFGAKQCTAL